MVFEWVTTKFKERQLKKAQIQAEADHMVIVSGLSILNPTARTFFKDMPFYDLETDSVDFKELEQYISDLRYWRSLHENKECNNCLYHDNYKTFVEAEQVFSEEKRNLDASYADTQYSLSITSIYEFEHLKKLFMELTGKDEFYYTSDFNEAMEMVKEYKEGYRNLDETISNFENKIYQKNKQIARLQTLLDKKSKEVVKVIEKEPKKDNRPITRSSKIYNKFKLHVLKRDEVCQCCGSTENLHVHHLSSYKHDKQRRADTSNGIVLCGDCHTQFHSLYGKGHKNNPVNFAKFMREYGKSMQVNLDYTIKEDNILLLEGK